MKLVHKLKSRGGETLTETLVAVLVVSLASAALAALLTAAVNLNQKAKAQDAVLYQAVTEAQFPQGTGLGETGTVTVTVKKPIGGVTEETVRFDVTMTGDSEGLLRAYYRTE